MRGLDPDKAAGNPPGFEIISSTASGEWQREKITMPGIDPVGWQADERAKLHSLFGISVMYEPLKGLHCAAHHCELIVLLAIGGDDAVHIGEKDLGNLSL